MSNNNVISEWFSHYSDDIYQYLIYRIDAANVEDLVQEVFIKAMKGLHTFHENSSPKTWLLSIARNVAIDEMRKKKWKKFIRFEEIHEPLDSHTPEGILQLKETKKELHVAIKKLKPVYRDVIILRGIKELSVEETAFILNWTPEKVRFTYHRAKKALLKIRREIQPDER